MRNHARALAAVGALLMLRALPAFPKPGFTVPGHAPVEEAAAFVRMVKAGDIEGMRAMRASGFDPGIAGRQPWLDAGGEPFRIAIDSGDAALARALVELRVEEKADAARGLSAIDYAIESGRGALVAALIEAGANRGLEEKSLALALEGRRRSIYLALVLDYGYSPNARIVLPRPLPGSPDAALHRTGLDYAIERLDIALLEALLGAGADPDMPSGMMNPRGPGSWATPLDRAEALMASRAAPDGLAKAMAARIEAAGGRRLKELIRDEAYLKGLPSRWGKNTVRPTPFRADPYEGAALKRTLPEKTVLAFILSIDEGGGWMLARVASGDVGWIALRDLY
jgi:hypothetical protein